MITFLLACGSKLLTERYTDRVRISGRLYVCKCISCVFTAVTIMIFSAFISSSRGSNMRNLYTCAVSIFSFFKIYLKLTHKKYICRFFFVLFCFVMFCFPNNNKTYTQLSKKATTSCKNVETLSREGKKRY